MKVIESHVCGWKSVQETQLAPHDMLASNFVTAANSCGAEAATLFRSIPNGKGDIYYVDLLYLLGTGIF